MLARTQPVGAVVVEGEHKKMPAPKAPKMAPPVQGTPNIPGAGYIPGVPAPPVPEPTPDKVDYQTIPGNPLEVAQGANPQIVTKTYHDPLEAAAAKNMSTQTIEKTDHPSTKEPVKEEKKKEEIKPVEPPPEQIPPEDPFKTNPIQAVAQNGTPQTGPGLVTAEVSPEDQNAVVEEIKADPKIGEQILQLAKDTGRTILEVVQGFAKGYSGSDIPLISQVRQEREKLKQQQQFAAEQTEKEREFAIQRDKVNQDFQMNIAQIQENWRNKQFAATTQAEKEAADRERDFQAQEAQKNRNTQLDIAKMQTTFAQEGRGMTRKQQMDETVKGIFQKGS